MKRFIEGESRMQTTLLPECLDDFVSETNPVCVVDVFVDELNLEQLGFHGVTPSHQPTRGVLAITRLNC